MGSARELSHRLWRAAIEFEGPGKPKLLPSSLLSLFRERMGSDAYARYVGTGHNQMQVRCLEL